MSESPTIAVVLKIAVARLRAARIDDAQLVAQSLLAEALACDRTHLIVNFQRQLNDEELKHYDGMLQRREAGEPLQYIVGRQEFFGLEFEVTPDVLIPRPESELIVEEVLRLAASLAHPVIVDVGTGSGCLAVTIARELPEAHVAATDISSAALAVARRNAQKHQLADRISFVPGDLLVPFSPVPQFDFIVSNPPYIRPDEMPGLQREVRDWEPRIALTDFDDGLTFYRRLLRDAPARLKAGGYLICEMGFEQSEKIRALVEAKEWESPQMLADLQGILRTIVIRKRGNAEVAE